MPDFSNSLLWFVVIGLGLALSGLILMILRRPHQSFMGDAALANQMQSVQQTLNELGANQNQLSGGLQHVAELQSTAQMQMMKIMEERLEEVSKRMNETLEGSSTRTSRSLGELQQRLETIDKAQQNIEKLSGNVLGLQDILANKQTRGAFGEIQLEDLVRKALPPNAYGFQKTIGDNKRVDCLIYLPNPPGSIAVDAKFPLEAYEALRNARDERSKNEARRLLKTTVLAHAKTIAEKYIVEGETADSALMFLPSEAVYAELHASFSDVIQTTFEMRVWLVSPTTLMATLNTMRAILKDAQMREQAGNIRQELSLLYKDIGRLTQRVGRLQGHFSQAQQDINDITISADKAGKRAHRLERFEFEDTTAKTTEELAEEPPLKIP